MDLCLPAVFASCRPTESWHGHLWRPDVVPGLRSQPELQLGGFSNFKVSFFHFPLPKTHLPWWTDRAWNASKMMAKRSSESLWSTSTNMTLQKHFWSWYSKLDSLVGMGWPCFTMFYQKREPLSHFQSATSQCDSLWKAGLGNHWRPYPNVFSC